MFVKQLSVFTESHEDRLKQVTEVLKEQGTNILSLSMVGTAEYGMLRMVMFGPDRVKTTLREKGFSATLTDMLTARLEGQVGELHRMTYILCNQGLSIEYMYALTPANRRAVIVKASDGETATRAVTDDGLVLYSNEEMYWWSGVTGIQWIVSER